MFKLSNVAGVSGEISGGGGAGVDWLDLSLYTAGVRVNLATGAATGAGGGVVGIQGVRGGSGNLCPGDRLGTPGLIALHKPGAQKCVDRLPSFFVGGSGNHSRAAC